MIIKPDDDQVNPAQNPQVQIPYIYFNPRCKYLEHLNLSGLDEHSTPADYNDLLHSAEVSSILTMMFILGVMTVPQVKEHYLNLIEDAVRELPSLVNLNLGTLVNNGILRIVSKTCPRLFPTFSMVIKKCQWQCQCQCQYQCQ